MTCDFADRCRVTRTERLTFHGLEVTLQTGVDRDGGGDVMHVSGPRGLDRDVRNMDHRNRYEDVAHEVRVWLIKRRRGKIQ